MNKHIATLFILTLLFFYVPITNPTEIISVHNSDLIHMGTFTKSLLVDTIHKYHELPLWNPYIFSGTPFLSNSQSAMFYPINYLFVLLPSTFTWTLIFILDIFLMGTFTYLFARKINLDSHSSLVSATIYMFAGTVSTRIYVGHSGLIDAMVWFPLILLLYEYTITERKAIYAIFAGFALSIMFFTGHVQFITYSLLVASMYYILRTYHSTHRLHTSFLFLISIIVLFSLIPIQLLPSLEFSQNIDRTGGISFADSSTYSITPQWFITFLIPEFFGSPTNSTFWHYGNMWELCAYVGIFPLILALISPRNKYTNIFLLLAIFTLAFALGKYTPVYSFFYNYIPCFDFFRAPARILFVYVFSISILAGFGSNFLIHHISTLQHKQFTRILTVLSVFSFFSVLISILLKPLILSYGHSIVHSKYLLHPYLYAQPLTYWYDFSSTIFSTIMSSAITFTAILIIITAIITLKDHMSTATFKHLILLIIVLDLFTFSAPYIVTSEPEPSPPYTSLVSSDRTLSINTLPQNLAYPNVELVDGYDSSYLTHYQEFIWLASNNSPPKQELFFTIPPITNLNSLKLLNTKYIITHTPMSIPGTTQIYNQNETIIYAINDTLPRAYIIRNATIIQNKSLRLATIQKMDIRKKIILESDHGVPLTNPGQFQEANITLFSPNKISMTANLTTPGFLVLASTHYPGWKAYDNNHPVPIYKTNHALQSIYLTEGIHNVSFIYDPSTYKTGKLISIISFIILTFIIIFLKQKSPLSKKLI